MPSQITTVDFLINDQFPGPTIYVNQHVLLQTTVVNLMTEPTTTRFHGLLQAQSLGSDGAIQDGGEGNQQGGGRGVSSSGGLDSGVGGGIGEPIFEGNNNAMMGMGVLYQSSSWRRRWWQKLLFLMLVLT